MTTITSSMNVLTSTYDYNGDGTAEDKTLTKTDAALVTKTAMDTAGNNLSALEWSPGLFMAAKDQTTYLATASSIEADHGDSTVAARMTKYGAATSDAKELSVWGDMNAQGVVVLLAIDDLDSSSAFQGAMLNTGTKYAGVASASHASNTKVTTVNLDSNFVTGSAYTTCVVATVAAAAPTGAIALAAASTFALAALF